MRRFAHVLIGTMLAAAGLGTAAGAQAATGGRNHAPINPATGLRAGEMPLVSGPHARQLSARPFVVNHNMTYRGGPVVTGEHLESVVWGAGTAGSYLPEVTGSSAPNFNSFLTQLVTSPYVSWLQEYNTPASGGTNQQLGFGSFLGRTTITPSASASTATVSDDTIQQELIDQVDAGHLPQPSADSQGFPNTIFVLFFPAGTTITFAGGSSGQVFCAYHNATTGTASNGRRIYYVIVPDNQSGGMHSGCGTNAANYANMTSYTSHEIAEAITDPQVDLNSPAWYNDSDGEIGDYCISATPEDGTFAGTDGNSYTVQKLWSNASATCLVARPAVAPRAPTGLTATAQAGGQVHLTWSPTTNDGGAAITNYRLLRSTTSGVSGSTVNANVPAGTAYTDTPPTDGTYYYTLEAQNSVGPSPASDESNGVTTDSTAPAVKVTGPAPLFATSRTVTTKYGATDTGTGVASYDVRYRSAAWNGSFGSYKTPWLHTEARSEHIAGKPGTEYCFSVRSRDQVGNMSGWSADHCQVVPLDDRGLATASRGWTRAKLPAAYLGTLTTAASKGASLKLAGAHVRQIALVVSTCPTCGKVDIVVGGLTMSVNTHSASAKNEVVVVEPKLVAKTVTIVLKSESAHPVKVDGIAIAH